MIHQITTLKTLKISNFYNKHIEFNFENESLNYLYVDNTITHLGMNNIISLEIM